MDERRRWRVTASRILVDDRWLRLRADTVVTPAGAVLEPWYVMEYADWVHVVAITPDDRLVMTRIYRHGAGAFGLELPGGVMDAEDASPEATARRELLEETGYGATEFRPVLSMSPNPASHANRLHTVLALGATWQAPTAHEPGETMETELVPVADLLAALTTGAMQHATQVSSLLLALRAAGRIAF
jgi:8-oxo-dGTP pyrophosphatase MutT (NUDIX family)